MLLDILDGGGVGFLGLIPDKVCPVICPTPPASTLHLFDLDVLNADQIVHFSIRKALCSEPWAAGIYV